MENIMIIITTHENYLAENLETIPFMAKNMDFPLIATEVYGCSGSDHF